MGYISLYIKVLKEHYVDFKGRAGRTEFWTVVLINAIIGSILAWIGNMINPMVGQGLLGIFNLIVLLPGLGVAVRRLHDLGKGGGWVCINFIPIVGFIWFVIMCIKPGEEGDNRFGAPTTVEV